MLIGGRSRSARVDRPRHRAADRDDGDAAAGRRLPLLVGLAAVLVAAAAYLNPHAFGIAVDGA